MTNVILFIDEFSVSSNSPNSKHVKDVINFLKLQDNLVIKSVFFGKTFIPGGLNPSRLFNFLKSFILLFFILSKFNFENFKNKKRVIITTSPPLLHLYCLMICRIFKIDCYVWLMDAHPELEARIFEKYGLKIFAIFLRYIERKLCSYSKSIICLDQSMKNRICENQISKDKVFICPPWATFEEPTNSKFFFKLNDEIKFIYAGNYGKVHDLVPFINFISKFAEDEQRKIKFTFIGMSKSSQDKINELFCSVLSEKKFFPRVEHFSDLIKLFSEHHFGIVSLNKNFLGVSCPSKAYSYLSQGLLIYYVGPDGTLTSELCSKGYGLNHDLLPNNFSEWYFYLKKCYINNSAKSVINPKDSSLKFIKEIILER